MAKIVIEVRNVGDTRSWKEEYECFTNPSEWAESLIRKFNATIRQNEKPREVVSVVVLDESQGTTEHQWHKINLITIVRGSKVYDRMECTKCGITGKRFGLGGIIRDSKYKAKKYEKCNSK